MCKIGCTLTNECEEGICCICCSKRTEKCECVFLADRTQYDLSRYETGDEVLQYCPHSYEEFEEV